MKDISLSDIENAAKELEGRIVKTPTLPLKSSKIKSGLPLQSDLYLKLELYQNTCSFKARGNILAVNTLSSEQKDNGVSAVSAGNHALAVSWAAKNVGTHAKLFMPKSADHFRIQGCRDMNAEVSLLSNIALCFEQLNQSSVKETALYCIHRLQIYVTWLRHIGARNL